MCSIEEKISTNSLYVNIQSIPVLQHSSDNAEFYIFPCQPYTLINREEKMSHMSTKVISKKTYTHLR